MALDDGARYPDDDAVYQIGPSGLLQVHFGDFGIFATGQKFVRTGILTHVAVDQCHRYVLVGLDPLTALALGLNSAS